MDKMIYLDNAATSFPKPDEVYRAMDDFYRRKGVNPGRSGCDAALAAEEVVTGCRRSLTNLFNQSLVEQGTPKDPNRLVFAANATAALNIVLQGLVGPGDHVVTTAVEHNSVIRPVNHLVKRGSTATFVKPDPEGYVDAEEVRAAIRDETKLVLVNHGSNVIGVVQDIEAIGAVCKQAGVPFAIDAAQTAGVVPIDMAACNVSMVTFTGHKGLMGPTGTGGVCVADDVDIEAFIWGGTGVRSAHPYHLEEYPYRLEAGTLNLVGIAGLAAGVEWITSRGIDKIHHDEMEMAGALLEGFAGITGVTIQGPRSLERRVATCSITVDGFDPSDVGTFLDVDYNVVTRTGLQCAPLLHEHLGTAPRGTVRFSLGPLNTMEHVEHTVKAVAEIAGMRN